MVLEVNMELFTEYGLETGYACEKCGKVYYNHFGASVCEKSHNDVKLQKSVEEKKK